MWEHSTNGENWVLNLRTPFGEGTCEHFTFEESVRTFLNYPAMWSCFVSLSSLCPY